MITKKLWEGWKNRKHETYDVYYRKPGETDEMYRDRYLLLKKYNDDEIKNMTFEDDAVTFDIRRKYGKFNFNKGCWEQRIEDVKVTIRRKDIIKVVFKREW